MKLTYIILLLLGTMLLAGCQDTTRYYSNCASCRSAWLRDIANSSSSNYISSVEFPYFYVIGGQLNLNVSSLPSSGTFNASKYYNKTQINNNFSNYYTKAQDYTNDTASFYLKSQVYSKAQDDLLDVRKIPLLYDEFNYWTTARTGGIGICAALSSGTAAVIAPNDRRIGRISFLDSTTAGGGYICRSDVAQLMYFTGYERFAVGFDLTTANVINTTIIMGFGDSTTAAEPTDGCYLYSFNRKMQGRCKNNTGPSKTSTNLTLVTNGKYIAEISMNQGVTSALFNVYNYTSCTSYSQIGIGIFSSCNLLWSNTVQANIPNAAARAFGINMIAFQSSTSAGAILVNWDYVLLDR